MLEQLHHLDSNYSGGLAAYIQNAKRLLEDSRTGQAHPLGSFEACGRVRAIMHGLRMHVTFRLLFARAGKNAFEGLVPAVPDGVKLDFGSEAFRRYEQLGALMLGHTCPSVLGRALWHMYQWSHPVVMHLCTSCGGSSGPGSHVCSAQKRCQCMHAGVAESRHAAFVLVAGGLGERLGYSGIKLALPTDLARGACFLQVAKTGRLARPFALLL